MPDNPSNANGPGWRIADRYLVTGRIGSGGMADVLRARDELLERDVAIKVFRSTVGAADTAAGVERQRAELLALARLNHPHLITLYDGAIPDDGPAYLVMELVDGPTLADRIDTGPLPAEQDVRVIGKQVAEALAYVHEQGMVHRDVKPANILLGTSTGGETTIRARLSDFGIVRLLGAQGMTQADLTLGTASYLAPEQARGSGVGPPADVYALGLTLLEALTGVKSFDAPTPIEAVVQRLDRDPDIPASLPEPWPGLLQAMTARDPAARPAAEQVARTLRSGDTTEFIPAAAATDGTAVLPAVAAAPPPVAPVRHPEPAHAPAPPPKQRNVGLIVGLVLALLLLGIGAAVLVATTSGDDNSPADTGSPTPTRSTGSSSGTRAPSTRQTRQTRQPSDERPSVTRTRTETRTRTRSQSQEQSSTPPSTPPSSETNPVPSGSNSAAGDAAGNPRGNSDPPSTP